MSHSVHFRDAAGEVQLEDVATLDAALERVEELRNADGATEVRVFREVPIEVKTYYRVVAVEEAGSPPEPVAVAEVAEVAEVPTAPAPAPEPEPEPIAEVLAPSAVVEPPSGAMVMSPPPVHAVPDAGEHDGAEVATTEHRRQLFSRS